MTYSSRIYMDTSGALLINAWEHEWALDYQQDKAKYLDNIWRIINWSIVNDRLQFRAN